MTAVDLVRDMLAEGVEFSVDGERVNWRNAGQHMTLERLAILKDGKPAVVAFLRHDTLEMTLDQASERAAIQEYDGGLTRLKAERAAALAASRAWGVPVAVILTGLQKNLSTRNEISQRKENETMDILSALKKLKTADEFADAIDRLEAEHASVLAAVSDLESQRESVIFDGGDLGQLESEISAAGKTKRTLDIALIGARKRHGQAVEAERQAELETMGKTAARHGADLRKALSAFDKAAVALAGQADYITALRLEIARLNVQFIDGKRPDLIPAASTKGSGSWQNPVDPLSGLHIFGLWPNTHAKTLKSRGV